eukprot:3638400-Rhodomonas_salina.1
MGRRCCSGRQRPGTDVEETMRLRVGSSRERRFRTSYRTLYTRPGAINAHDTWQMLLPGYELRLFRRFGFECLSV